MVLVNLERDAGQNVGALSHVFVLFRLMKERGISQAYLSVLTACYWTSRQKYKIRQKHIRRITGLAPEATVQNFQRLIRDGHLESHGKRGKGRWFTMTHKGKIHATDIFHQLYMRIVDFYDQKNPVTESAGLFGGIEKRNQTL